MTEEPNPNPQAAHSYDAAPEQSPISPRKVLAVAAVVLLILCVLAVTASCAACTQTALWPSAPMPWPRPSLRLRLPNRARLWIPLCSPAM